MRFRERLLLAAVLLELTYRPAFAVKISLPIMAVNPGGTRIGFDRSMQLAVNDINEMDSVLADYELRLYINHTNVSSCSVILTNKL